MPQLRALALTAGLTLAVGACDSATPPEPLDGRVEGIVEAEAQALAGLEVRLESTDGSISLFGVTDASGAFGFDHLDEGTYEVRVPRLPDHVVLEDALAEATLAPSRPTARVQFKGRLKRDADVSVEVRVDDAAWPGATVDLDGPETRSGVTGPDGRVVFTQLVRGRYDVVLSGFDPERVAFPQTIESVNARGGSGPTVVFSGILVPRIPASPGSFAAAATDATTLELSWVDAADNESRFELERRTAPAGSWAALASPDADATSHTDDTAAPATTYDYRLRACNEHGCSDPWIEATASTPDVPPTAPTNPTAGATGPNTVAVAWTDASANESRFEVERRVGSGAWVTGATLPADTEGWTDDGLATGTVYGYRIRACNDVGCSPWTDPVSATTSVVPPAAPTGLSATAVAYDRIDLAWTDASADETGFLVERQIGSGTWSDRATLAAGVTTFTDGAVSGSTGYGYRVRACNDAGCSDPTPIAHATTPSAPPNLDIAAAYVIQRVQRSGGDVPLVADLDGLLRVFPRGDRSGIPATSVRVRFYQGGALVQTTTIAPPVATMPTGVDESSLALSWNLPVPSSLLQPGLGIRIEVDPDDTYPEGDESDNLWPAAGVLALDVRATPDFAVTFVPVRQSANNTVGNVDAANAGSYLSDARRMMPFAGDDVALHAEFTTDQPVLASDGTGWSAVLSEVAALRTAEGSTRAYYGVVPTSYGSGVAGIGYIGWPISLGWDRSGSRASIAAHEWGHNFGRRHSPGCGAGNPDASYPHAQGKIGVWGFDLTTSSLKSPSTFYDLMSYCGPEWISDYVYEAVMDHRGPAPAPPAPVTGAGAVVDGLLVWGRVDGDRLVLEPAFEVRAPATLPASSGALRLEGRGDDGVVFSLSFDPVPVADGAPGEGHFAFVVPVAPSRRDALRSLHLTDGARSAMRAEAPAAVAGVGPEVDARVVTLDGATVEVQWNAVAHPMALVRDAATGEILSFGRGGTLRLSPPGTELSVTLSDGLRSTPTRVTRWR